MEPRRVPRDVFDRGAVFEAPTVRISRWRCRRSRPDPGSERAQPRPLIIFLRSGNFRVHSSAEIGLLDSTRVGLFNANVPFRSAHPYSGGDSGADFAFRADILAEAFGPGAAEDPDRPFRRGWAAVDGETALLQSVVLGKSVSGTPGDELEIEEIALRLAARVGASDSERARVARDAAGPREREEADALRGFLSARPGARHRLDELASRFGSTPFRLCRSFRAATGTTIHRHLTAVRLHQALDRLVDGCRDLTGLALDLGFSSHSHFTATFRRHLGATPENVRGIARAGGLSILRRKLGARTAARN